MDLSIIIVNTNVKSYLKDCLRSIFESFKESRLAFEIFVVDNNSSDGSQKMVKEEFPTVILMENQENLGFPRANNQAIRIAKGNYLLLLNPDTVITPGSLDLMVEFMEKNQEVGAVGPKLIDINGFAQPSVGKEDTAFTVFLRFCLPRSFTGKIKKILAKNNFKKFRKLFGSQVDSYLSRSEIDTPIEIDRISGACLLFRRKITEEIGLLDEKIFLYSEDADLCLRIKKKGWKVIYFPIVEIIHYGGKATGGSFSPFPFCYEAESAYYYFKKHYNKTTAFVVRLLLSFALIARVFWFLYHHIILKREKKRYDLWKTYRSTLAKIITGKNL